MNAPNRQPDAFTELFLRHQAELKTFVVAVVRDWGRSEDILQEVSIVLWRKFDQYDSTKPFGPWARGVAWREVLKDRRRDAPAWWRAPERVRISQPAACAAPPAIWHNRFRDFP